MTVIAGIIAGNVSRIFASCSNAVVATNTIANNAEVIENSRKPACRAVTVVALIAGGNMVRSFSGRLDAVMAGYATARY